MGTLVEIITFYLLREWGLAGSIAIERSLPEYGNRAVTHNVEFTLHPVLKQVDLEVTSPVTSSKVLSVLPEEFVAGTDKKNNAVLDKNNVVRNACVLAENNRQLITANLSDLNDGLAKVTANLQLAEAYAMFECKRVGVEEGNKKGPQTIEKAKQGAYVAQVTSALQKIRDERGNRYGLLYENGIPVVKPYNDFLEEIIRGKIIPENFILSVGVVSNHGNWFTSENQNKELKVLAESYDWLLFLSDEGLSTFVTELLLQPDEKYLPVKNAFMHSYKEGKKANIFTKTKMDFAAHIALCSYFSANRGRIEDWFNVIAPASRTVADLKDTLYKLKNKERRNMP